jgi:GNAT superfamily N-acetyltransferase
MDARALLAAYDAQVRQAPHVGNDAHAVERDGTIVRVVRGGWGGVVYSALDEHTVDAAIAAQIERFADHDGSWEWKHYSYDTPADLPARLEAAGFVAEEQETVLVAEIAALDTSLAPPTGVELREITSEAEVLTLVALGDEVFGSPGPGAETLLNGLRHEPRGMAAMMAFAEGEPVAGGRVEFDADSEFAGMWGGFTHARWRGRGIFRALVAYGAALARARGYGYLHVDAAEASLPILRRAGFVELAKTTPYKLER